MTTNYLKTGGIISNNTKRNLEDTKPSSPRTTEEVQSSYAENILGCIAILTLVLGIIGSIVILTIMEEKLSALFCFISSIITWAVLKVLCNISNNLHEINKKMKG